MAKSFSDLIRDNGSGGESLPMEKLIHDQSSGGERLPAGMSWDKFFGDIGKELAHQVEAGSHELAAALFNGSGFVMYPRNGENQVEQEPHHGLPVEAPKVEPMQKESEGLEM